MINPLSTLDGGHQAQSDAVRIAIAPLDTRAAARKYAGPCVPVAFAMVARSYGLRSSESDAELIDDLANAGGTPLAAPGAGGAPQEGKFAILRRLGLRWDIAEGFDAAWLSEHLRAGRLVVVGGKRNVLPGSTGQEGHAIVVNGLSANAKTFLISDSTGFLDWPVSAEQLREFVTRRPGGIGTMIAVYPPGSTISASAEPVVDMVGPSVDSYARLPQSWRRSFRRP